MTGQGGKATQFRKGQSGNPKGRPRKPKPVGRPSSAFDVIVDRTLQVTKGGRQVQVDLEEALQHKTYRDAVAGCRTSRRLVMQMIEKREKAIARKTAKVSKPGVEVRIIYDPTNAEDALEILGIARRDTDESPSGHETYARQKLETWAVNAALRRRRGGSRLTSEEVDKIEVETIAPDEIRWPRSASG